MIDTWFEISCDVPVEHADLVADFLAEITGRGVSVENRLVDAFSTAEIAVEARASLKAYLPGECDHEAVLQQIETFLESLRLQYPDALFLPPAFDSVRSEEWSSSWKVHFKPLRIGKLLILPTWEDAPHEPGDLVIRIDPGMAFGTGGHETTRLCLELLEYAISETAVGGSPSLLDLGTGSGILAMAGSMLGAGRVLAVDIDPDAVAVARENLLLNGLERSIECGTTPLESITEQFDVIMANILAEELVRLSIPLTETLQPGGVMILSGILDEKESFVMHGFATACLKHEITRHAGEWVAMLFRKAGRS